MGMIDNVKMPEQMLCINCGAPLHGFQTKDGKASNAAGLTGSLDLIEVKDVEEGGEIYTDCRVCQQWNEYIVQRGNLILNSIPHGRLP